MKSTIFNFVAAWKEVKVQTIENGWSNLFDDQEKDVDLEGLEAPDFCTAIQNNIGEEIAEEDMMDAVVRNG